MNAFEKIIGYTNEKNELYQISDILNNHEIYAKLGANIPKGLLLYGEPGVGKTLMAECLIESTGRKAFTVRKNLPDGEFVNHIKSTFEEACKNAPSIVYLDDMDKFANEDDKHCNSNEYVTIQSCIDSSKNYEVFVIATVNNEKNLPKSLLRPGRFDRRMTIDPPRGKDAELIIRYYLKGKPIGKDVDFKNIAGLLSGRSCAVLETVINEAAVITGFRRDEAITMKDFVTAYMDIIYGIKNVFEKREPCPNDAMVAYHEAGHALASELFHPESVELMAIHKKGGLVVVNKNALLSKDRLYNMKSETVIYLAGKAATESRFGKTDLGENSDLSKAYWNISDLVSDYGMLGMSYFAPRGHSSDKLQYDQEKIISAEMERYAKKASELMALNRDMLDSFAKALIEKDVLLAEDIREIKSRFIPVPVSIQS